MQIGAQGGGQRRRSVGVLLAASLCSLLITLRPSPAAAQGGGRGLDRGGARGMASGAPHQAGFGDRFRGGRQAPGGGGFSEFRGRPAAGFARQGFAQRRFATSDMHAGNGVGRFGPGFAARREGGGWTAGRRAEGFRSNDIRDGGRYGERGWHGSAWGAGLPVIGLAGAGLAADYFWRSGGWWQPAYGWDDAGWRWNDAVVVGGPETLFAMPPVVFAPPPLFVVPPPIVLGAPSFLPPVPVAAAPPPPPPPAVVASPVVAPEQMFYAAVPPPIVVLPPPPVLIAAEPPPVIFAPQVYPLLIAPPLLALTSLYVSRVMIDGFGPDWRTHGWDIWRGAWGGDRPGGYGDGRPVGYRPQIASYAGGRDGRWGGGWHGGREGGGWHAGWQPRARSGGWQEAAGGRGAGGRGGWSGGYRGGHGGGLGGGGHGGLGGSFHRGH